MKKTRILVLFALVGLVIAIYVQLDITKTPYRFVIEDQKLLYLTAFCFGTGLLILFLMQLIKDNPKIEKNLTYILVLMMFLIGGNALVKALPRNVEHEITFNDVSLYGYSDEIIRNGSFKVTYYLQDPDKNLLNPNRVMERFFQPVFLDSYKEDLLSAHAVAYFNDFSHLAIGNGESQIPGISKESFPYAHFDNEALYKFRVSSGSVEYVFVVTDRALGAELISVYRSTKKSAWEPVRTLDISDEIYDVFMTDETSVFVNYGSYHEGTMYLMRTDNDFKSFDRVTVPYANATDVYVKSIESNQGELLMIASGPRWSTETSVTTYRSANNGLTWVVD